ncbi:uncharacterized protein LOC121246806 [Juglans microcarpa x Juglans regia]|uniref:uncharacterized protein LOC121246806 n=1 Tax=Juglans microcarpa x Juglans regia TaxID=2249226 RepID=UPI001B7E239E|nr:uncharacterized protein LOC121246806 [Juglans microcarpa x Juglans regia]
MEVAMEVEDDLFFADLSKQISLLIMDEEEEDPVANFPVSLQEFSREIHPPERLPPILCVQTCRRESKGTGVFIPQSSLPRRKKRRQGRFASYNAISRRKPDTTGMAVSQASSNHSFRPKKVG